MTQTDIYASRYELEAWADHQWWYVMNDMIDALARGGTDWRRVRFKVGIV